jgi:hypothetical protein
VLELKARHAKHAFCFTESPNPAAPLHRGEGAKERREAGLPRRKKDVHANAVALIWQAKCLKIQLRVIAKEPKLQHQRDFDSAISWGDESFFEGERFFKRRSPEALEIDGIECDQTIPGSERVDDCANFASRLVRDPGVDAGNCCRPLQGKETTSAAYFSRAMVRKAGSIRSCSSHQREFAMASSRPGPEMASASLRNR